MKNPLAVTKEKAMGPTWHHAVIIIIPPLVCTIIIPSHSHCCCHPLPFALLFSSPLVHIIACHPPHLYCCESSPPVHVVAHCPCLGCLSPPICCSQPFMLSFIVPVCIVICCPCSCCCLSTPPVCLVTLLHVAPPHLHCCVLSHLLGDVIGVVS